jgi:hypothetical protein
VDEGVIARFRPSSTAMNDASPTVKAGRRICHAMTQANWIRDRKSGSRLIGRSLYQAKSVSVRES